MPSSKSEQYRDERSHVVDYIRSQIIGPFDGENECLYADRPTARYLMGTLFPQDARAEENSQEEDESNAASDADELDDSPLSMVFQRLPASMGLSFYVQDCTSLEVGIYGGEYRKISKKETRENEALPKADRTLKRSVSGKWPKWVRSTLASEASPETLFFERDFGRSREVSIFRGKAKVHIVWRSMGKGALVTVTLLNAIQQSKEGRVEPENCLYQVGVVCRPVNGVLRAYPSVTRLSYDDEEEELALQYRNNITYAVGHGCAATWEKNGRPDHIKTISLPYSEVKPVTTTLESSAGADESDVLGLQYLADENMPVKELEKKLNGFIKSYVSWLDKLCKETLDPEFEAAGGRITGRIRHAAERMQSGATLLCSNKVVRRAFAMANSAMLRQMIHSGDDYSGSEKNRDESPYVKPNYTAGDYQGYAWRPFQLAYQLLVLESLVVADSEDRDIVDLLWFPTGGGKTEAYLALAAFELIYRRFVYGEEGAGTTVIKRYTLRLLTTQQFQRAATLICALELMRREKADISGVSPFTLGLWVGQASSPNKYSSDSDYSKGAYELYRDMLEEDKPENAFQLQKCPWCGTKIIPGSRTDDAGDYGVKATQTSFKFFCPSSDCELHDRIPVTVVDEDIYAHPPSFIIGTVDKFARLAWDHRAAGMFGNADGRHRPPSLIIQDELHLISGPLGTIAGVYEAAIGTLIESKGDKPKIIAATATIRRAADQVQRLYGSEVGIFPPPGLSADDSYFARIDHKAPGRLYLGVMGQGHTAITTQLQVSAVLSQALLESNIGDVARDSWWTQVIYHNSRRELGKTMTLARDDIPERVKVIAADENNMRKLENVEELSANIRGIEIPEVLSKLGIKFNDKNSIDILPCTNMISVGVDVSRLGLMLVVGQPKTTAEYIQASSRVGRSNKYAPGIVVTLYSSAKPRDRSHYENFDAYHGALYRAVEPTSVTPFAPPSRDRALHAALVVVMRHACGLGPEAAAGEFDPSDDRTKEILTMLKERMILAEPAERSNIERHMERLVEQWSEKISESQDDGRPLRYHAKSGRQFASLLRQFGSNTVEGWQTLNSMRNVDVESVIKVAGEEQ